MSNIVIGIIIGAIGMLIAEVGFIAFAGLVLFQYYQRDER